VPCSGKRLPSRRRSAWDLPSGGSRALTSAGQLFFHFFKGKIWEKYGKSLEQWETCGKLGKYKTEKKGGTSQSQIAAGRIFQEIGHIFFWCS
jgi:hypothetical protein